MSGNRDYFLIPKDASQAGVAWKLKSGSVVTLGREIYCDVILEDPRVSRTHARLDLGGNGVRVQDAGSASGTYIDGKRVTSAEWLAGAVLKAGATELVLATGAPGDRSKPGRGGSKQTFVLEWTRRGEKRGRVSTRVATSGESLIVGRTPDCDIILDDPVVSRSHARFDILPDCVAVNNLSRTRATSIANQPITDSEWLIGQTLAIGPFDFKLHVRHGRPASGQKSGLGATAAVPTRKSREPQPSGPVDLWIVWRPKLLAEEEKPKWLKLAKGKPLIIGKEQGCDILLADTLVSRRHVKIDLDDAGVWAEDLDSTNGTKVGGVPVKRLLWPTNQVLEIGHHVFALHAVSQSVSSDKDLTTLLEQAPVMSRAATAARLRVFISYSRRDSVFAEKLTAELEAGGFDVTIDRRDLPYGEEWQRELSEFIRVADTVVFLVSPDSISSKWCAWELKQVKTRRKRLFPLIISNVALQDMPAEIGEVHLLPPSGVFDFGQDFPKLVKALNTDQAWVRAHTRYYDRALDWLASGGSSAMLLRGVALKQAQDWVKNKPRSEKIAKEAMELIERSRKGQFNRNFGIASRWGVVTAGVGGLLFALYQIDPRSVLAPQQTVVVYENSGVDPYRSVFFARLSEALGGLVGRGIRPVGDRFVFESDVLFDTARAELKEEGKIELKKVAKVLEKFVPEVGNKINWVIQVDGHTDKRPIATAAFPSNLELSMARATSVVVYLKQQGVPAERLVPAGHGENQPLDQGESEDALRRNRRIELKLTDRCGGVDCNTAN